MLFHISNTVIWSLIVCFVLSGSLPPAGDQPAAIAALAGGVRAGEKYQVLHGVTGSGKTIVIGEVIAETQRPALVLSPTKVLAIQTYQKLKELLPHNAVGIFQSDYIRFTPETYKPGRDSYIEKRAVLDPRITQQRIDTVTSTLTRRDVVVVASVSAIFGIGSPETLRESISTLRVGQRMARDQVLVRLDANAYRHSDGLLAPGTFRVCSSCLEIHAPTVAFGACRIEFANDRIEKLSTINPGNGEVNEPVEEVTIYPAGVVIMPKATIKRYTPDLRKELARSVRKFKSQDNRLEAQRLYDRTLYDIDRMERTGYTPGIEAYSRVLRGAPPGALPDTLVSFLPENTILFLDESHLMVPQISSMHNGNETRSTALVEHGFRLPSARDHRPLSLEEVEQRFDNIIYVSATPRPYELEKTAGKTVEMVIRPTHVLDPIIEFRPSKNSLPELLRQIRQRVAVGEQALVMATTIRAADEVAGRLAEAGIRCKAMHKKLKPGEREALLDDLRAGRLDVLVGINLLREGLSLRAVSLVAILDTAKGGLHRSETDLLQMIGRTTRNVNGRVMLFADTVNKSMQLAITTTRRNRKIQEEYNQAHGKTPVTVPKAIRAGREDEADPNPSATATAAAVDNMTCEGS